MSEIEKAVERFMREGGWDKPKEIEEIKDRWKNVDGFSVTSDWWQKSKTPIIDLNELIAFAPKDIEDLLSSLDLRDTEIKRLEGENRELQGALEKEEQAHVMSVYDLNMKIAELGIVLEKEKEAHESCIKTADNLRTQLDEEHSLYLKEKERADIRESERDELRELHDAGIREAYRICGVEDDGEYRWKWVLLELSSRVDKIKELEDCLESFKSHHKVTHDALFDYQEKNKQLESRIKELKEAVKDFKKAMSQPAGSGNRKITMDKLFKILEEVSK